MALKTKLPLYRDPVKLTIAGLSLDYIEPSLQQIGTIMEYLSLAIEDTLENKPAKKDDLILMCIEKLALLNDANTDPVEKQALVARLFITDKANVYMYKLIKECFPEVDYPERLKVDILTELVNAIFLSFHKIISQAQG